MTQANLEPAIPQLPSGDLETTRRFFETALGFETVANLPEHGFLAVRRGAAELHFWETPTEDDARQIGQQSSCYIRVEGVRALFDEFKGRHLEFRYELTKQPWGMNEMQLDDPYGNAIRFGEPLRQEAVS